MLKKESIRVSFLLGCPGGGKGEPEKVQDTQEEFV